MFPRDNALLYINVPATRASTIDTMSRAHDFIVGPTLLIQFFPAAIIFFQLRKTAVKFLDLLKKARFHDYSRPFQN
jgi:hypothetical protein